MQLVGKKGMLDRVKISNFKCKYYNYTAQVAKYQFNHKLDPMNVRPWYGLCCSVVRML